MGRRREVRREVVWTQAARRGLDEALSYVGEQSRAAARELLAETLGRAQSLATLGERGRRVPELARGAAREVFVHRYRLLYRVSGNSVVILAFLHGARDFARWRQESEA